MEKLVEAITDLIEDHWVKFLTGLGVMAIGWIVGNWRAKRKWEKKEFFDRLNVSLNSISDGTLRIRTILEKSCLDVFLNSVATAEIVEAAQKTTEQDATLPLPKEEYWYFLNPVLNEVAEKFSSGIIRRDLGLNTKSAAYLICLTSECDDDVRTRKVRAMLIQKSLLEKLPKDAPKLEAESHSVRWKTLRILATEWQKNPWKFLEMEIVQ
jgi:hypothetical protein